MAKNANSARLGTDPMDSKLDSLDDNVKNLSSNTAFLEE